MQYLRYAGATRWFAERGIPVAEATLRKWVSKRKIPFTKAPGGKAVLFDPARLEQFIGQGAVEPKGAK